MKTPLLPPIEFHYEQHSFRIIKNRIALLPRLILILALSSSVVLNAQSLPSGFSEVMVVNGLSNPTAMAFAPDGRIFIAQQSGQLRIVKNGSLLSQPFISLSVHSSGERGLLGIAFDPNFSSNNYIYLYYTLPSGSHNRISRFTASGDVVQPGSEVVVLDLDPLSGATNHNGGNMQFGPEGKLYIGTGENADAIKSQQLDTYHGKLLRINPDGSVPPGNPFPSGSAQQQRVWAYGLRNPFTLAFQPGTGRLFVNDVGASSWEEINDATTGGKNFGWPQTEGYGSGSYAAPVYAYPHGAGSGQGCAITGGTFFNPGSTNYPAAYIGRYFFLDYCNRWIDMLSISGNSATRSNFATNLAGLPVALTTGTDGNLYFLSRNNSALYKIIYSGSSSPVITNQPQSQTVAQGNSVSFSVSANGSSPLSYQWRKNGENINGANNPVYTISSVNTSYEGTYSVVVSNAYGTATSNGAILTVTTPNQPPKATIISPAGGATYSGGQQIFYSGTGTDPEDGNLPQSNFSWYVIFHHDTHTHPGPSAGSGTSNGSFTIPNSGETSDNVWYRLYLLVTDQHGARDTAFTDIYPRKSIITLNTNPQGLTVTLDGQPFTAPLTVTSVEGILRTIGTPSPQTKNSVSYQFSTWSQGGSQNQTFPTPENDVTYTANFVSPVVITSQPQNATAVQGNSVSFSVTASGSLPISYQWRKDGNNINGANSSVYQIASVAKSDEGNYSVVVSNAVGSQTSNNATLTVTTAPVITSHPQSQTVTQGNTATFSVTATGTAPLSYQWRKNGANISGANASSYSIASVNTSHAGTYSVVVSNAYGSATSNNATLTVTTAPVITSHPQSQTVTQGNTATFSVTATGTAPLSYQWRKNGANISGANSSSYSIASVNASHAGNYSVAVSNAYGSATSNNATLTVTTAPVITTHPQSQTVTHGNTATFSVTATGTAPLSYQWRKNGANISGANASSYSIASVNTSHAGTYSVVVSNSYGSIISNDAGLNVSIAATAPTITSQPQSITVMAGNTAMFSVSASGTEPLQYSWRKNGVTIPGAKQADLSIPAVSEQDAGDYSVEVSNEAGTTISQNARLTVISPPSIVSQPQDIVVNVGSVATFTVTAKGSPRLSYQWRRNGQSLVGANDPVYTIPSVSQTHVGNYSVVVANEFGMATSREASLTLGNKNQSPVVKILSPASGTGFGGGQVIQFSGSATDPEDGNLNASSLTWRLELHHDQHVHPGPLLPQGVSDGSFTIPDEGETSIHIFYRLYLLATDSKGARDSAYVDLLPRTSNLTLNSDPQGLSLTLDGNAVVTPHTFTAVEGMKRSIGALSPQNRDTATYYFIRWSNGGAQVQTLATLATDSSFTAFFDQGIPLREPDNPSEVSPGLDYSYYHGTWNAVPDFPSLFKEKAGTIHNFDLSPRTEHDNFAFHFHGFIQVPVDGVYRFYTESDEGSLLLIGKDTVVQNDSLHYLRERSGEIGLKAGLHEITVAHFEKSGQQSLSVVIEGPGMAKQEVPDAWLFRKTPQLYTLGAVADAYVRSGVFHNVNDGFNPLIMTGSGQQEEEYQSFLRFDISHLPENMAYARLRLYGGLKNPGGAITVSVHHVGWQLWLERTITNANKPAADASAINTVVVSDTSRGYHEWDLTQYLINLRNAGAMYVSLQIRNAAGSNGNMVVYHARENDSFPPQLVAGVNYLVKEANRTPQTGSNLVITKGLEMPEENALRIYPNPVSHEFTVQFPAAYKNRKLQIMDLSGRPVKEVVLSGSGTQRISVDNLIEGMYILYIEGMSKKYTYKMLIRR